MKDTKYFAITFDNYTDLCPYYNEGWCQHIDNQKHRKCRISYCPEVTRTLLPVFTGKITFKDIKKLAKALELKEKALK